MNLSYDQFFRLFIFSYDISFFLPGIPVRMTPVFSYPILEAGSNRRFYANVLPYSALPIYIVI